MSSPLITIILPYYSAELTLERAIKSITAQTFQDFEFILVNNNSSDKSEEVALQLASQDSRIKLISEARQGVVYAANTGMKAAQGKYIARMDADDVARPERLEKQLHHLNSNPDISISATQVDYKTEKKDSNDFSHFVDWSNQLNTWQEIYNNRWVEFPVVNPTLMFRRSILEDVGYLKEGYFPEDYEWFLRAIKKGHKIEKVSTKLLEWYDYDSRLTRSDDRYRTEAFFQIKTEYLVEYLKANKQTKVWIWGAGKLGFKRSQWLLDFGIKIEGYIDIKENKQVEGYTCLHFEDINLKSQPFILSYVSNRGRRDEIRSFLTGRNYQEGNSFLIVG